MSRKPIIGLTCDKRNPENPDLGGSFHVQDTYCNSLHSVGAAAVILPHTFDEWDALDGILFTGGGDISPARGAYDKDDKGEPAGISDARDDFEIRAFHAAKERELPMLGICRGCQFLNYAHGGVTLKDIAEAGFTENHRVLPFGVALHPIVPVEGTLVGSWLEGRTGVASHHHQAVKTPGKGLIVSARSPEGVIEAIEHENGRVIGLQFHPERTGWKEPFEWLANLAREHMEKR